MDLIHITFRDTNKFLKGMDKKKFINFVIEFKEKDKIVGRLIEKIYKNPNKKEEEANKFIRQKNIISSIKLYKILKNNQLAE